MHRVVLVLSVFLFPLCFFVGCAQQQPQQNPNVLGSRQKDPRSALPVPPPRPVNMPIDEGLRAAAKGELIRAWRSEDAVIRAHAIEAMKELVLAQSGGNGRGGNGGASPTLRDSVAAFLLAALSDREALVRFAGCMACGETRLGEAKAPLLKLVMDPDAHVQIGAIFALHRLGDVSYSRGLEESLKHADPSVRADTVLALGRLGEPTAVRILRPVLKDPNALVRLQCAEAIWRLGHLSDASGELADAGRGRPASDNWQMATRYSDEALSYLVASGLSGQPAHQMVAILAMASVGDSRVIQHVRAGLRSDYVEVQLVAARGLGMLGSDEAFEVARKAAASSDARQRGLAARALGDIGRPDAQQTLGELLKDGDADVRLAAAAAILQLR